MLVLYKEKNIFNNKNNAILVLIPEGRRLRGQH